MAQDDNLLTPFWKHWFATPAQRCLIPFTAFAEAEGPKGKRSEESRVGKECASTCSSRWARDHRKKNNKIIPIASITMKINSQNTTNKNHTIKSKPINK